jgi:hypothetical protein
METCEERMNIEYFRQVQMHLEKIFKKIGMSTIVLSAAAGLIIAGAGILISFVKNDIDVFTNRCIPVYTNPVTLFFIAINMIGIVILDKKKIIKKEVI